jgi:Starch-binding associating with outer membrane
MKNLTKIIAFAVLSVFFWGCEQIDEVNPNVANEDAIVSSGQLLARLEYELYWGGGKNDNLSGSVSETPFGDPLMKWNQYMVSNDIYYGGDNQYFWTNSASNYNMLKNCQKMEKTALSLTASAVNPYSALSKFFKAYSFIWLTQRVGDIPMSEAGQGLKNETPKFDKQVDVYKKCFELLDSANIELTKIIAEKKYTIANDIYFSNSLVAWQKVVNTYRLRVLISLSKKADNTPELKIKDQFNTIISNPTVYPIMTGTADNLKFVYNDSYNQYPRTTGSGPNYNDRINLSSTMADLLVANKDPRIFAIATPAPIQVDTTKSKGGLGKAITDYSAYVGSNYGLSFSELQPNSAAGKYSFINYLRYLSATATTKYNTSGPPASFGDESKGYIIVGYTEMCFNIAEAINRGWVSGGSATTWYKKGMDASMAFFGIADGATITIASNKGATKDPKDATKPLVGTGTITIGKNGVDPLSVFFAQPSIAYKGDNADGLEQILNQKYIAMWMNSGWEAFYNWRRTGMPKTFVTTGSGINPAQIIPRRFQYPTNEAIYNAENYKKAISDQFGGTDDLNKDLWINK